MTASASSGLESSAILICLGILCIIAVLLNLLIIVVLVLQKKTNTDYYMINLSVGDIVLAGVSIPIKLSIAAQSHEDFSGSDLTCKLLMFTPIFSVMSCILSMVAIAVDRTFVIVYNWTTSLTSVVVATVIIWILAVATSAPQIYEYSVYTKFEVEENKTEIACGSHGTPEDFETVYASFVLAFAYVIPLAILVLSYGRIGIHIWKTSKAMDKRVTTDNGIWKKRVRVIKMLIAITVLFAIFWAPYFILFARSEITGEDDTSESGSWLYTLEIVAISLSALSNPVIYIASNKDFWKNLRRASRCRSINSVHPTTALNQTNGAKTVSKRGISDDSAANPGHSGLSDQKSSSAKPKTDVCKTTTHSKF